MINEKIQKLLISGDIDNVKVGLVLLAKDFKQPKTRKQCYLDYQSTFPKNKVIMVTKDNFMLNTGRYNVVFSRKHNKHYKCLMGFVGITNSDYYLIEL